jgi:hypothetical protein
MVEEKVITLYLESWQKRMLQDFAKSVGLKSPVRFQDIVKLTIDFKKPQHTNSYRVPNFKPEEEGFDIYFTDAQMAKVEARTGLKAFSLNITKARVEEGSILMQ